MKLIGLCTKCHSGFVYRDICPNPRCSHWARTHILAIARAKIHIRAIVEEEEVIPINRQEIDYFLTSIKNGIWFWEFIERVVKENS